MNSKKFQFQLKHTEFPLTQPFTLALQPNLKNYNRIIEKNDKNSNYLILRQNQTILHQKIIKKTEQK